jgi:XTP/dITP diphosphohydrolase
MSDQVVLATNNAKKLAELRRLVAVQAPGIEVLGLADVPAYPEPAETERTFEGNALLKARACAAATGLPALADDSGLAVDVLNGMPGVRSARWAGRGASDAENNALLLRQLADVPPAERTARFVCAMALVLPDGGEHVRLGEMWGRISVSPAGHHGFGYDPLFVADGYTVTNGELEPSAKDAISHRGRAVRAIVPVLMSELRRLELVAQEGMSP